MKELIYKFQNPYNSCEEIHYHLETKRYYVLMPYTPYSKKLCTCTPCRGYYEADCPVKAGLEYIINGQRVVTEGEGEIINHLMKEEYENQELAFYQLKPEFQCIPNYQFLSDRRLLPKLYDYMDPAHFSKVTHKRKEVYCMMGFWYLKGDC